MLHSLLDLVGGSKLALLTTFTCLLAPALYFLYRYRSSIKARVEEIEKNISLVKVVRNTERKNVRGRIACMELDPTFVAENPSWNMMSMGTYLGQLEPAEGAAFNHLFLRKELEVFLGGFLLRTLGKTYGAALLPVLGAGSVAASIGGLAKKAAEFIAGSVLPGDGEDEGADNANAARDPLSLDVSLMELISFVNLHQKFVSSDDGATTPLEYLSRGENAAGDLSYDLGDGAFPRTFDLDDFDEYVTAMERRILAKEEKYDPDDRSFPPSTPVNERLLPGLHLGKGDLQCTHTRREGVEHRLTCVLLNKLSHNYCKLSRGEPIGNCFKVKCNGKECSFPEELIQGLIDTGHEVEVCPRVILSNFGMQFCVKEDDGSFTYVPTAINLRTGVERTSDGKPAYFAAPHGGMDLNISGPLVGKGARPAWIQFYVSIGGLTCFHPDEDQDAPWARKTALADPYSPADAIRAMRVCAVVAATFNGVAGELNLPFGGYGMLGMCNDSSTLVDFALRGETNAYPLLSTGRYLNHIVSFLIKFRKELAGRSDCEDALTPVVEDILRLICSTSRLPSDLHITPASLVGTSRRYDVSYGNPVFQSTADAKEILREMADTAKKYLE